MPRGKRLTLSIDRLVKQHKSIFIPGLHYGQNEGLTMPKTETPLTDAALAFRITENAETIRFVGAEFARCLERERGELMEVLRWYSDAANWKVKSAAFGALPPAHRDHGDKARALLDRSRRRHDNRKRRAQ